jgi:hypothetical protein
MAKLIWRTALLLSLATPLVLAQDDIKCDIGNQCPEDKPCCSRMLNFKQAVSKY